MNRNVLGVVLSVILIGFCSGAALLIKKKQPFGGFSDESARKAVHIGVSNWAFIWLYVFESWVPAFAGLLAAAVLNLVFELARGKRRSWGMVEYPLVIAFLVLLYSFGYGTKQDVACALLCMGYGDGLAAVAGTVIGGAKMPGQKKKTVAGSLTVFFVVFLIAAAFSGNLLSALAIGTAAAAAEAYTPLGLDNLSVPLVVYFLLRLL